MTIHACMYMDVHGHVQHLRYQDEHEYKHVHVHVLRTFTPYIRPSFIASLKQPQNAEEA